MAFIDIGAEENAFDVLYYHWNGPAIFHGLYLLCRKLHHRLPNFEMHSHL